MQNRFGISLESVKQFVNYWNVSYPIDYWWRQKHNVAFNSLTHQQSCFIDQLFEYLEERAYEKILSPKKESAYEPGRMNYLKKKIYTVAEEQEMFDNLDLDKL